MIQGGVEAFPLSHLRMIAGKRRGKRLAMTGDDTPASKLASLGIAMGLTRDVAKDAADLALTDEPFAWQCRTDDGSSWRHPKVQ